MFTQKIWFNDICSETNNNTNVSKLAKNTVRLYSTFAKILIKINNILKKTSSWIYPWTA